MSAAAATETQVVVTSVLTKMHGDAANGAASDVVSDAIAAMSAIAAIGVIAASSEHAATSTSATVALPRVMLSHSFGKMPAG